MILKENFKDIGIKIKKKKNFLGEFKGKKEKKF